MSPDENKDVLRRLYEDVFNTGNVALADEIIAPNCLDHNVDSPVPVAAGPGPIKGFVTFFRTAFPDAHWAIEDIVGEEDKVAGILTLTGTNTAAYRGIPATGKTVELSGLVIFHVADGMVIERWGGFDALGLLQQLGIAESVGSQIGRPTQPASTPEEEANKALMRRMYNELFNHGKLDLATDMVALDAVDHTDEGGGGPNEGANAVERIEKMVTMLRTAFPDGHWAIEQMVAEGDRVGCRVVINGTNTGPFMVMPPTGRPVTSVEMLICRIEDGKIAETWHQVDVLGMRRQLMGGPPGAGGPPGGGPPGGGPPGGGPPGGFPGGGPPGGGPPGGFPGGRPGGGPPGGFPGGGPPGGFPGGGPPTGRPPGSFSGGGPPGGFPGGGPPGGFPPGGPPPGASTGPRGPGGDGVGMGPADRPASVRERNKRIVYRLYDEVFNQANYAAADGLVAPDMEDHAMAIAVRAANISVRGAGGIIRFVERFRASFPDQHWTVDMIVGEGNLLMARCSATGTHTGDDFEGIPAAGRPVTVRTMVIFRVEGDRIVERWAQIDTMGLLGQLGAGPPGGGHFGH